MSKSSWEQAFDLFMSDRSMTLQQAYDKVVSRAATEAAAQARVAADEQAIRDVASAILTGAYARGESMDEGRAIALARRVRATNAGTDWEPAEADLPYLTQDELGAFEARRQAAAKAEEAAATNARQRASLLNDYNTAQGAKSDAIRQQEQAKLDARLRDIRSVYPAESDERAILEHAAEFEAGRLIERRIAQEAPAYDPAADPSTMSIDALRLHAALTGPAHVPTTAIPLGMDDSTGAPTTDTFGEHIQQIVTAEPTA